MRVCCMRTGEKRWRIFRRSSEEMRGSSLKTAPIQPTPPVRGGLSCKGGVSGDEFA